MIFVCVGSREYQFNRLLVEVDSLVKKGTIKYPIFAQIGKSEYQPKYFEYTRFLSKEKFDAKLKEASIVISHGGTGALIGALKLKKKVIAVPRLLKFKEHSDNHQVEICNMLHESNYLVAISDICELSNAIESIKFKNFNLYNRESKVTSYVLNYISKGCIDDNNEID